MLFSIVTPSYKQLDWLRLCVASVRDQVTAGDGGMRDNPEFQIPQLMVEHIIQDAGTSGIEDFAREIGADFYRGGQLVFSGKNGDLECEPILARPTATGSPKGEIASQIRSAELSEETSHSKSRIPSLKSAPSAKSSSPITNSKFQISNYSLAIYSERDKGMYDAVNRGFAKATGDLLAYLNCDEQYLPGALRSVAERFETDKDLEMLFADAVVVDGEGNFICFRKAQVPFRDQLWFRMPVLSCATFAKRTSFTEKHVRLDETKKVLGDVIWIMRAQQAEVKMGVLRRFTSAFTETEQNLGVGGIADAEFLELRSRMPAHVRRFLPVYEVFHKVRSLLAGTRSHPPFSYEIFLRGRAQARQCFDVQNPTAVWRGRTGIDKAVVAGPGGTL